MSATSAMTRARIIGLGRYAPERRVENADIESRLGLGEGWIERRTGIRARRYAADHEAVTDLAAHAAEAALTQAGVARADIALTLLATSTPDHLLPPSAPLLAHRLGLTHAGAIDLAGACAGFVYALTLADSLVRTQRRPVLVVGANVLSRRINPADRDTSIIFADAAGAVVVAPAPAPADEDRATGLLGVDLVSDGSLYDLMRVPAGGSRRPFSPDLPPEATLMEMRNGRAVFASAVELMTASSRRALAAAGLTAADISRWIPHQANIRIVDAVRRNLGLPESRLASTIADYGNSSAATIPFSMAAAAEAAPFVAGERVLLTAVGAGLTAGAIVYGF